MGLLLIQPDILLITDGDLLETLSIHIIISSQHMIAAG